MDHLIIPDPQVGADTPTEHFKWLGDYIVRTQPETIVCLGDFADMSALSSYDRGHKSFEGRRYKKDVEAVIKAQDILLSPLRELQVRQKKNKTKSYSPKLVMLLGNHENRINRAVDLSPELDGTIGIEDLRYKDNGWEVYPFLDIIELDGVHYTHFVKNKNSDYAKATAKACVQELLCSVTQGHRPGLDIHVQTDAKGRTVWGIIAGSFYLHDEAYRHEQGNSHWRGIIHKREVREGSFDPEFISIDSLKKLYDNRQV